MVVVIDVEPIRERFLTVAPFLDERGRRLVAAAEAFAAGYGGIAAVAMGTGMVPSTIGRGLIGEASNTGSGNSYGVHGITRSSGGNGVVGQATAASGVTSGLYGVSDSNSFSTPSVCSPNRGAGFEIVFPTPDILIGLPGMRTRPGLSLANPTRA